MSSTPGADELRMRTILRQRGVGPDAEETAADAVSAAAAAVIAQPPAAAQPQPDRAADPDARWWDALYADGTTDTHPAPAADDTAQPDADADAPQAGSLRDRLRIQPWWTGRHVDLTPDTEEEDDEDEDGADAQPDADDEDEDGTGDAAAPPSGASAAQPKGRVRKVRTPAGQRRRAHGTAAAAAPAAGAAVAAPAPRMSLLDAFDRVPSRIRWLIVHGSAAAAGYRLGWVQWSTRTYAWIDENGWLNLSAGFWVGCAIGCELLRRQMRNRALAVRWAAAVPIASLVTGSLLYGTGWQNLELPL